MMSLLRNSNRTIYQSDRFILLALSVSSETYTGTQFSLSANSSLSLPPDLPIGSANRLIFAYYYNTMLTSALFKSDTMTLSSPVLSASVPGLSLSNLSTPLNVMFVMVSIVYYILYSVYWTCKYVKLCMYNYYNARILCLVFASCFATILYIMRFLGMLYNPENAKRADHQLAKNVCLYFLLQLF